MGESEQIYTANIVDTVIFRSLGKSPNQHLQSLKQAVEKAGTELWVSPSIYRELADYGQEPPRNPYLDTGIEEGWIRVATPLPGNRETPFDSISDPVERARHLADSYVNDPAHGGAGLVSVLDLYPVVSWCEVYPQLGVLGPDFRAY